MINRVAALSLAVALTACSRQTEDWVADLRSDEPFVRLLGAAALRDASAEDCERVVRELVQLRYDSTRVFGQAEASLRVLAARFPETFVELVDDPGLRKDRWVVLEPLVDLGAPALPHLEAALGRGAPAARRGAAAVLGRLGAIDVLSEFATRGSAAREVALDGLRVATKSKDDAIRAAAERAIRELVE